MKPTKNPHCLCCKQAFKPDPRNAHHQKYCAMPACRKASKAASQRRWLAAPENHHYHRGPEAVARVRAWQKAHPEYRERQKAKRAAALQDHCIVQVLEFTQELPTPPDPGAFSALPTAPALQDVIDAQPLVLVGLIAHFFNLTLQDDIANTARSLQELGEDITMGREIHAFKKAGHLSRTYQAGTGPVQLGGSTPGTG